MPRSLLQHKNKNQNVSIRTLQEPSKNLWLVIVQKHFILPCFCIQHKWRQLLMIPHQHKPFGAEQWAQADELAYLRSFINNTEVKVLPDKDGVIHSHARRCYHWLKIETHFKDKVYFISFSTTFSILKEKIFPIKLNWTVKSQKSNYQSLKSDQHNLDIYWPDIFLHQLQVTNKTSFRADCSKKLVPVMCSEALFMDNSWSVLKWLPWNIRWFGVLFSILKRR